jgi:(1->4)-alpha-D-glucan 1-alpha-D-glucosylmutase
VDFDSAAASLADGSVDKQVVTSTALRLRRDRPELFTGYTPLRAEGPAADHVLAFDRGGAVCVVTRLPFGLAAKGGWGDTLLELPPGRWRNVMSGFETLADARSSTTESAARPSTTDTGARSSTSVKVAELLGDLPVALLVKDA